MLLVTSNSIGQGIFIWYSIGACALVLVVFCLGWALEQMSKHKFLAWIFFIGLAIAVIAYASSKH